MSPLPRAPVDCGGILSPLSSRLVEAAAIDAFTMARRAGRSLDEALAEFDAAGARGARAMLQFAAAYAPLAPEAPR